MNNHDLEGDNVKIVRSTNMSCGDEIALFVEIIDEKIQDISFVGSACSITIAATSIFTELVKGKTIEEAKNLSESARRLVNDGKDNGDLSEWSSFVGVSQNKSRSKCAYMPWEALNKII